MSCNSNVGLSAHINNRHWNVCCNLNDIKLDMLLIFVTRTNALSQASIAHDTNSCSKESGIQDLWSKVQ